MKNETRCPYLTGKSEKRIICTGGCFAKFYDREESRKYYFRRCLGRFDKCNIFVALNERGSDKTGGA